MYNISIFGIVTMHSLYNEFLKCLKKNSEISQINDLMLHLKLLENKNEVNPKPADGER
jgi:hypothetical protein